MVGRLAALQGRQASERHGMDVRQDLAQLPGDPAPGLFVGRIAQQLARDRRAVDAAHDEGLAQPVRIGELEQHLGRPHAGPVGRPQHAELGGAVERRRRPVGLARGAGRIAPQDQPVARAILQHGIEAPGLARGAARFAAQAVEADRLAEVPAGGVGQDGGDRVGLWSCVNGHSPDCGTGPAAW